MNPQNKHSELIEGLTKEELKAELLTLDGKGKDFKQKCLDELLSRERQEGRETGAFEQSFYGQSND